MEKAFSEWGMPFCAMQKRCSGEAEGAAGSFLFCAKNLPKALSMTHVLRYNARKGLRGRLFVLVKERMMDGEKGYENCDCNGYQQRAEC